MKPATFQAWTWFDAEGRPVYVGWGGFRKYHPAIEAFRNQRNSPLGVWLSLHDKEPPRQDYSPMLMHRLDAMSIAAMLRERYRKGGVVLLSNREFDSWAGGGTPRPVQSPEGDVYMSVREAAAMLGIDPSTVTRNCANPKTGWKYLLPPATPLESRQ